jgi:signal transduction histidine kinase
LRAPLRSIDGFTRILLGSTAHKFDEEEKALFTRVLNAADRMNVLIEDLLNLSRVTRTPIREERVDLSSVAANVAGDLSRQYPDANILIHPGVEAVCDPSLIEVALRNLLENGCKFSSHTVAPCVEFGVTSGEGERVLYVRDNGAGFDPAYESKLFLPFQRLHRQEEFPGTGIGLATVSRIIHRHGGWIKAESAVGKGATFSFSLASLRDLPSPNLLTEFPEPPSTHSTVM